ncbi:MAG: exodeoxyribonuclease III [Deltaproteobacteria bacterium]|nr:exodeoxyribonuclease III [Deltaproteobacteria bacterium]
MKIATWNVNSIRARLPHVVRWLEGHRPDVLCLQELKVQDEEFPRAELEALGYRCAVAGQKTYNGVAILCRDEPRDPSPGLAHLPPDHPLNGQKRLLAATVTGVRVISAYLPNGEAVGSDKFAFKLAFFRELREYLARELSRGEALCLCGDFNVAPEPIDVYDPAAWEGQVLCSEPERAALAAVRALGFDDCFRRHHPEAGRYSWWDYRMKALQRKLGLRIDHVWATAPLAERCTASDIDAEPRRWERPSDHAPVWAEFSL